MRTRKNHQSLLLAGVFTILAALACNAPEGSTPPTLPPPTATAPQVVEEASPTPSPSPTDTPVPDVSGPGGCTLNGAYVADVTVPDNAQFDPGATFTKVWRVRNSGTCAWEKGAQLVLVSGESMSASTAVDIPQVAPDSTTNISVDMTAPDTPGTYRSTWQLQGPDGVRFGSQIYVQIIVPEPVTETPTPTTEEPDPPDLVITNLEVDTDDPRQGILLHIVATLRNQGGETAEGFHWAWRVCVTEECAYVEAPGDFTLEPGEEVVAEIEYLFGGWSTYTTEAWVDARDEIEESDETNNTLQLIIPVKAGMPDLVISAITFDPDPPVQGRDTTVQVSVRNHGSKPAGVFDVEWWGGMNFAAPSCEWTLVDGLEEGETANMVCTFAYTSWYGNITTRAIADVDDTIAELDEANNTLDKETAVNQP